MDDFIVDPLYYQNHSANKNAWLKRSNNFIANLFSVTPKEVSEKSAVYINNPDGLRDYIFIVSSWDRLNKVELTSKSTTLFLCIAVFAMEGLNRHIMRDKRSKKDNFSIGQKKLYDYLSKYFTQDENKVLLNSFIFSKGFNKIPMGRSNERHLMYRAMRQIQKQEYYKTKYCFAIEDINNIHCNCIDILNNRKDKLNVYLNKMAWHLYKMRCSVVHDGITPMFCHAESKPKDYASWGLTICDMYNDNKKKVYYRYSSSLSKLKFEEMFLKSLWRAYCAGLPKKI